MRTRPTIFAALTASAALLLGACTSDADPQPTPDVEEGPGDDDATDGPREAEDAAGSTAAPASRGYLCRYVTEATQKVVAERDLTDPYQLMVENDETTWVCEARDGDDPWVRVSILRGEGIWDTQRALAQEHEGVVEGPAWLGEGYQSPRRITGLTMCATSPDPDLVYEPYALVVEAVTDSDLNVVGELNTTASALARGLDQAVGCSPKMARGEVQAH